MGGMAAAFAPAGGRGAGRPGAERRCHPGRVGAPRRGRGHPALQLAGLGHGQQDPPGAARRRHRRGQGAADLPGDRAVGGRGDGRERCRPACSTSSTAPTPRSGAALVGHPGVDMVSFTGGVRTGQAVMAAAAATTRPVVLELGGNDAAILAPDVAGDRALAERIVEAAFVTSGQVCMAIKRLYVHRDRLDETVDALAERLSSEVVGDGLAEGVTMGPGAHRRRPRPGGGHGGRGGGGRRDGAAAGHAAGRGRGLGRLLRLAGRRGRAGAGLRASCATSSSRRRCR